MKTTCSSNNLLDNLIAKQAEIIASYHCFAILFFELGMFKRGNILGETYVLIRFVCHQVVLNYIKEYILLFIILLTEKGS